MDFSALLYAICPTKYIELCQKAISLAQNKN